MLVRSRTGGADHGACLLTRISQLQDLSFATSEDVTVDLVLLPESWDARLDLTRISAVLARRPGADGPAHLALTCSGEVVPLPLGASSEMLRLSDYELAFIAATIKSPRSK